MDRVPLVSKLILSDPHIASKVIIFPSQENVLFSEIYIYSHEKIKLPPKPQRTLHNVFTGWVIILLLTGKFTQWNAPLSKQISIKSMRDVVHVVVPAVSSHSRHVQSSLRLNGQTDRTTDQHHHRQTPPLAGQKYFLKNAIKY